MTNTRPTVMEILGNDTSNVLAVLESATPEQIAAGRGWYPLANRIAKSEALRAGKPVDNLIWMLSLIHI